MGGAAEIRPGPEVVKKFILDSAEDEISIAHKNIIISRNSTCFGSDKPRMLFLLLLNAKMPTIVGILTFMSKKKS